LKDIIVRGKALFDRSECAEKGMTCIKGMFGVRYDLIQVNVRGNVKLDRSECAV